MKHALRPCLLFHLRIPIALLAMATKASAASVDVFSQARIDVHHLDAGVGVSLPLKLDTGGGGASKNFDGRIGTANYYGLASVAIFKIPKVPTELTDPVKIGVIAKNKNPVDTSVPPAKQQDSVTTTASAKYNEVIVWQGTRLGVVNFNGLGKLTLKTTVEGEVEVSGDPSIVSGRVDVLVKQPSGAQSIIASSNTHPQLFLNQPKTLVGSVDTTFSAATSFGIEMKAVACIAKYKASEVFADAGNTLTLNAIDLEDSDGKRFDVPELRTATGADFSRLINLPEPGTGAGEFAFSSDLYAAGERDGTALIRIHRELGNTGAATVIVRNSVPPPVDADFEAFSTTVEFKDGETQKGVFIKILDDNTAQNSRSFGIELASPSGATLHSKRTTATVTIEDDEYLTSPYPPPAKISAIINPGGPVGQTGVMNITITKDFYFTFSGVIGGRKFSGRGADSEVDFIGEPKSVNIPGIGPVAIRLLYSSDSGNIMGIFGSATLPDGKVLPIRGTRIPELADGAPATTKTGNYTMLLDPVPGAPGNAPKGIGYAQVQVLKTGQVRLKGKLADGVPFTASGPLTTTRQVLIHAPLSTKGQLSGVLHLRPNPNASDLDGEFLWHRPPSTRGVFQQGFTTRVSATGALYVPPATGGFILPSLSSSTGQAVFHAQGPDLSNSINIQTTVLSAKKNTVTAEPPDTEKLRVKLIGTTGMWNGTFRDNGKTVKFQGALHQLGRRGGGFFLGSTNSGAVSLTPGVLPP